MLAQILCPSINQGFPIYGQATLFQFVSSHNSWGCPRLLMLSTVSIAQILFDSSILRVVSIAQKITCLSSIFMLMFKYAQWELYSVECKMKAIWCHQIRKIQKLQRPLEKVFASFIFLLLSGMPTSGWLDHCIEANALLLLIYIILMFKCGSHFYLIEMNARLSSP